MSLTGSFLRESSYWTKSGRAFRVQHQVLQWGIECEASEQDWKAVMDSEVRKLTYIKAQLKVLIYLMSSHELRIVNNGLFLYGERAASAGLHLSRNICGQSGNSPTGKRNLR